MTDFVLVHGAFRGAWAWDRVRALLEASGHRTAAPDLTAPDATLPAYIDAVVGAVGGFESGPPDASTVVLVGHSQGGFVARAATQRLGSRLSRLVAIDAPIPAHGQTAFDFRPTGTPPPPVAWGDVVAPRPVEPGRGLSADDARWINDHLVGQPVAPSMEAVELDDPAALAVPVTHVFFGRAPQGYPCDITRAELDDAGTPYQVIADAPHDGIVSHAEVVAEALLRLTEG